jgi:hypothetical protein
MNINQEIFKHTGTISSDAPNLSGLHHRLTFHIDAKKSPAQLHAFCREIAEDRNQYSFLALFELPPAVYIYEHEYRLVDALVNSSYKTSFAFDSSSRTSELVAEQTSSGYLGLLISDRSPDRRWGCTLSLNVTLNIHLR